MDRQPSVKQAKVSLKRWFRRWFVSSYLKICGYTLRLRRVNWHVLEALWEEKKPFVTVMWHNGMLTFFYFLRYRGFVGLASKSDHGEDIAWVGNRSGIDSVSGSSSYHGAMGLRAALRALKRGNCVFVTPDGPRGPRYVFKSGALGLARLGNVPLIPIGFSVSRRWVFRSWDAMRLPKFFSVAWAVVGQPISLGDKEASKYNLKKGKKVGENQEAKEAIRLRAESALREVSLRAEQLAEPLDNKRYQADA